MNFRDKLKFFQPKSDKNNVEKIEQKLKAFNEKQDKKIKELEDKREKEKKQKEKEEKKKLEEQREKNKEIKKKQEEEKKKQEEERKKQKEEEKKKQEQKEKVRQEHLKKMEEEEKKKKEEKVKILLEQEKELTKLLKRQNIARNEPEEQKEMQSQKLYQTLEDMCKLGKIIKNQIIEEKEKDKQFISIEEAIKQPEKLNSNETSTSTKDDANGMRLLGLLAQNLEEKGITTVIEKNKNNSDELSSTSLQFLVNGLIDKPKFVFSFEFGEERNNELLNNEKEQKIFNNKLKKKLSMEYNIPEDKIIIICPEKGSYKVTVIFMSDEFNNNFNKENFINSCTQEEFRELCNLKDIQKGVIMDGVKLNLSMLDSRGNQSPNNYGGGKRGGEEYFPPMGWKGYGLKVMDVYDNGNNDWLAMNNNSNEWAVAYHGIGKAGNTTNTEAITNKIIKGGDFKNGLFIGSEKGQARKDDDDIRHPGNKVGEGVYCTPDINVAEGYAGSSSIVNGKRYKMIFMMRVKPDKIRSSNASPKEWILDGTTNEMRPYRILLKEA